MDIAEIIRKIREEKRLRQVDVANALEVEQANYAYLEKRGEKLTIEQLRKIADALGVTIKEILFYGEPDTTGATKKLLTTLKRAIHNIKVLKQKLRASEEKADRLRREVERFAQALHKLAYDEQKIIGEMVSILRKLQETTFLKHRSSDFEFYWFVFIKEITNDTAIMQAYITCRNVEMGRDFLQNLMYSFYECMTALDGMDVSDAEEWKNILFNHSNISKILELAEQTKLKLDIKSKL